MINFLTKWIDRYSKRIGEQVRKEQQNLLKKDESLKALKKLTEELTVRSFLLKESEEKYKNLINTLQEGILQTDRENRIVFANNKLIEMLGYADDFGSIIGKTTYEFMDKKSSNTVKQQIEERKKGIKNQYELNLRKKDGINIICSIDAVPLFDAVSSFNGALVTLVDITKRKEAEQKLEWELITSKLLENLAIKLADSNSNLDDIGKIVLEASLHITNSTAGFVATISRATGGLVVRNSVGECNMGSLARNEFHPNSDGTFPKLYGVALNTKKSFYTNNQSNNPFSEGVPEGHIELKNFLACPAIIDCKSVGLIGLANCPLGYDNRELEIVERISDLYAIAIQRERDRRNLTESEKRYKSFVINFDGIAYRVNPDGKVAFFTGIVEKLTGYTSDDFISGKVKWESLVHSDDFESYTNFGAGKTCKEIGKSCNGVGESCEREYRIITKNGQIKWIHENLHNLCNGSLEVVASQGCMYDITHRLELEERLYISKFSLDHYPHAIFWTTEDGKIMYANIAATKSIGIPLEKLEKMYVFDFDPIYTKEIWRDHWEEVKEKKKVIVKTIHINSKGESIPREIITNYLEYKGTSVVYAFVETIIPEIPEDIYKSTVVTEKDIKKYLSENTKKKKSRKKRSK